MIFRISLLDKHIRAQVAVCNTWNKCFENIFGEDKNIWIKYLPLKYGVGYLFWDEITKAIRYSDDKVPTWL